MQAEGKARAKVSTERELMGTGLVSTAQWSVVRPENWARAPNRYAP